jgi:hypothetical protein
VLAKFENVSVKFFEINIDTVLQNIQYQKSKNSKNGNG